LRYTDARGHYNKTVLLVRSERKNKIKTHKKGHLSKDLIIANSGLDPSIAFAIVPFEQGWKDVYELFGGIYWKLDCQGE
jgi:hypothetical protein